MPFDLQVHPSIVLIFCRNTTPFTSPTFLAHALFSFIFLYTPPRILSLFSRSITFIWLCSISYFPSRHPSFRLIWTPQLASLEHRLRPSREPFNTPNCQHETVNDTATYNPTLPRVVYIISTHSGSALDKMNTATPSPPPTSSITAITGLPGPSSSRRPPRKSTLTQQQKNQKRQRATQDQLVLLEVEFNKNPTPTAAVRERIAQEINMTERSVQIWFQNRYEKQSKWILIELTQEVADVLRSSYLPRRALKPGKTVMPSRSPIDNIWLFRPWTQGSLLLALSWLEAERWQGTATTTS